jgi:hypothetical protein
MIDLCGYIKNINKIHPHSDLCGDFEILDLSTSKIYFVWIMKKKDKLGIN